EELVWHNFEFSGNRLCKLWNRDDIYGKPITVHYVDQISQPFGNIQVDKISLAAASSNFRVAKNIVDCNLSDDEILNLRDIQSDNGMGINRC
ncbi:2732_t:CDS:2, partial [Dentiscutata heterogama]